MGEFPKVLVISHNVLSLATGMGRTMADMLSAIPPGNLAQLYFHSEVPTLHACERYFRITDKDVLRSLLPGKKCWRCFGAGDILQDKTSVRTDKGLTARIYQWSRRRSPLIYLARNTLWKVGRWKTSALDKWIREFAPDVIFFASGDYAFSYRITVSIAKTYGIPVVMWCCDDYYFSKRFSGAFTSRLYHADLMKCISNLSPHLKELIVISDKMQRDYGQIFQCPISTLRISAQENPEKKPWEQRRGVIYAGSLGVNRIEPLLELGRALKAAQVPGYEQIEVYSGDRNPETLQQLTAENGLHFHGRVDRAQLQKILGSAKYLLHVEAFDQVSKSRTRYSLSTKIGESLQSGACILAYGPQDISSMEYLVEYEAAQIVEYPAMIGSLIEKMNTQPCEYRRITGNAAQLAARVHNKQTNDLTICSIFCNAVNIAEPNSDTEKPLCTGKEESSLKQKT